MMAYAVAILLFALMIFFPVIGFFVTISSRNKSAKKNTEKTIEKIREDVANEIQNTPAADLVDAAANADQLRSDADGITGKFRQRLRDRAGKILSGKCSSGTDACGGSGN